MYNKWTFLFYFFYKWAFNNQSLIFLLNSLKISISAIHKKAINLATKLYVLSLLSIFLNLWVDKVLSLRKIARKGLFLYSTLKWIPNGVDKTLGNFLLFEQKCWRYH